MTEPPTAFGVSVPYLPSVFHVMAKPTGAVCNLDCEYCYFLSKEQLYQGSKLRMSDAVLEAYVGQLLEAHVGADEVVVAFQGGEPTLMGLAFFRRVLEVERRCARRGQKIQNTIQTNGTMLTDAWGDFLAENQFLVGLSIDGPRSIHDAYRVDKGGRPTFERVMRGLGVLKRHRVEWNALTTVHAANGDHGRAVYAFLRDDCGAVFIQFIPIVERTTRQQLARAEAVRMVRARARALYRQEGDQVTSRSVGPDQYGRFMIDVFEEWIRHDVGSVFVQLFDTALGHWLGMEQGGICVHAKTCGLQVALEHNGDLYSCDHFVEPKYLLGNISQGRSLRELVNSPSQLRFGLDKYEALPQYCLDCDVRFACNGGCPKDRFAVAPTGDPGLNYLCTGYRQFFRHVDRPMRLMARLVRSGREARGVMEVVLDEDARRLPNSPCSCGGAETWEQCHGGPVRGGAASIALDRSADRAGSQGSGGNSA